VDYAGLEFGESSEVSRVLQKREYNMESWSGAIDESQYDMGHSSEDIMHEIDNTSIDAEANMRKKLGKKPPGIFRNRNLNVSETEVCTSPLKSEVMVSQNPRRFSRGFTDDRFNISHSYLKNLQMGLPQRSTKFAGTFTDLRKHDPKKKNFKRRMEFPALRKQKSAESYRKGIHSFSHLSNIYGDEKAQPGEIKGRSYQELEVMPSPAQVPIVEDLVNRMLTDKKSENIRSKS
jgi:hypothetical protein